MGQQQLILLVLATVIVGLAIVVGIRAFTENSAKANADALVHDVVRMASDAQAWKKKPAAFGGQAAIETDAAKVADPKDFSGATLALLGYPVTGDTYSNLNGDFTLNTADGTGLKITAVNCAEKNEVVLEVTGLGDLDIKTTPTLGKECTAPPAGG